MGKAKKISEIASTSQESKSEKITQLEFNGRNEGSLREPDSRPIHFCSPCKHQRDDGELQKRDRISAPIGCAVQMASLQKERNTTCGT